MTKTVWILAFTLSLLSGCASFRPEVADARSVTGSVFDCVDAASTADNLDVALFACGVETLKVVDVLCSSGAVPAGEFCDRVSQVLR